MSYIEYSVHEVKDWLLNKWQAGLVRPMSQRWPMAATYSEPAGNIGLGVSRTLFVLVSGVDGCVTAQGKPPWVLASGAQTCNYEDIKSLGLVIRPGRPTFDDSRSQPGLQCWTLLQDPPIPLWNDGSMTPSKVGSSWDFSFYFLPSSTTPRVYRAQ